MSQSNDIPEHESPLRRMMANAQGTPFQRFERSRKLGSMKMVLPSFRENWGGQIYAVIPVRMILCSLESLQRLLLDLDTIAWSCNETKGLRYSTSASPLERALLAVWVVAIYGHIVDTP